MAKNKKHKIWRYEVSERKQYVKLKHFSYLVCHLGLFSAFWDCFLHQKHVTQP